MDLIDRQAAIDECYPVTVDGEVYYVPSDEWAIWENREGLHKVPRNFCPNCGAYMKGDET